MSHKFRNHIKNNVYLTTFVSESNKIIYMRPGRTAGTVITLNLPDVVEVSRPYFFGTGSDDWLENITDEEIKSDYFVFTFVRNTFERLVSAWSAFVGRGKVNPNFEKFVKDRGVGYLLYENGTISNDHWFPQSSYVEYTDGEKFVDFIGKFENLEKDWEIVSKRIGIERQIKKHSYRTTQEYYRLQYTDELVEIISDLYKRDLELLDYEF